MRTLTLTPTGKFRIAFVSQNGQNGRETDILTANVRIGFPEGSTADMDGTPIKGKSTVIQREEWDTIVAAWRTEALAESRKSGKFVRFETVQDRHLATGILEIPGDNYVADFAETQDAEALAALAAEGLTVDKDGNIVPLPVTPETPKK